MRSHRAVLAAALVLASSTAAAAGSAGPPPAGGPWHELTSENFVLRTDLGPERARGALEELELTRALLLAAMFDRPVPLPDRIEVVVFADRDAFVRVTGARQLTGYYFVDPAGRRRIVVSGGIEIVQIRVVKGGNGMQNEPSKGRCRKDQRH